MAPGRHGRRRRAGRLRALPERAKPGQPSRLRCRGRDPCPLADDAARGSRRSVARATCCWRRATISTGTFRTAASSGRCWAQCPPALSEESAAFRLGGFGTHENVLYYELVRHLIGECWQRVVEPAADAGPVRSSPADVLRRLACVGTSRTSGSNEPDWEDLSGRTPAEVDPL